MSPAATSTHLSNSSREGDSRAALGSHEEMFPDVQVKPPLVQREAISSCAVPCCREQSLALTWLHAAVRESEKARRSPWASFSLS